MLLLQKHNKIKLSKEIGGIKYSKDFYTKVNIKDTELNTDYTIDTSMNWATTFEQENENIEIPNGSYTVRE